VRLERDGRFWEATHNKWSVRIAWGAIGSAGQRMDRSFPDEATAKAYFEKHVAEYRAKGYVEIAEAPPEPPKRQSRHERFEWNEVAGRHFLEVVQSTTTVHYRKGRIVDGKDRVEQADTRHESTLEEAIALYDEHASDARYAGGEAIDVRSRDAARAATKVSREHGHEPPMSEALPARADVTPHDELEAQCFASPDSREPWDVYADWLEGQGDPRGAIARAAEPAPLIMEQLRGIADEDDIEDELRGSSDHEVQLDFELRFGFVRHATIVTKYDAGIELATATRRFLSAPVARFVDSLRFGLAGYESNNDWEPTLRAIAESAQGARMRRLEFDLFDSSESELSWVEYGDFSKLLSTLPALEHLKIRSGGGGVLGSPSSEALRSFVRVSGGLGRREIDEILAAKWPNLEALELWTGSSAYGADATPRDLYGVLAREVFPKLRHLGIVNSELSDELIPLLARAELLPQLESLDLSRGIGSEAMAKAIVDHAAAFRHLAAFDLSANVFSDDECEAIRGVLDNVILDGQRGLVGEGRYVVVGE
jgi:uncharacterized protein (TIGR02996 family)